MVLGSMCIHEKCLYYLLTPRNLSLKLRLAENLLLEPFGLEAELVSPSLLGFPRSSLVLESQSPV